MATKHTQHRKSEAGAIVLHALVALGVVFGVGALAVDLGMLVTAQSQLETVADSAALAGAKELPFGRTERAIRQAGVYARHNRVMGEAFVLAGDENVILGEWHFVDRTFDPGSSAPNSVRVTARRSAEAGTAPIGTWFASLFGVGSVDVGVRSTAAALSRDIVLVIDRSGSMGEDPTCAEDPSNTGIAGARDAAVTFLQEVRRSTLRDRVGLVTFAHRARREERILDLSQQFQRLARAVEDIEAEPCGVSGGTNTGGGIDRGCELYDALDEGAGGLASARQKVMILLSDGIANRTRGQDHGTDASHDDAHGYSMEAARDAAAAGITIHTITLGLNGQFADMRDIALATGGRYLLAPKPEDLEALFLALATDVRVALVE